MKLLSTLRRCSVFHFSLPSPNVSRECRIDMVPHPSPLAPPFLRVGASLIISAATPSAANTPAMYKSCSSIRGLLNSNAVCYFLLLAKSCIAGVVHTLTRQVLVISDKCGDAYAAPLPQPASTLKHLLGHTAMTITSMVSLKGGRLLATGDRAEHIRISQVCVFSLCQVSCFACLVFRALSTIESQVEDGSKLVVHGEISVVLFRWTHMASSKWAKHGWSPR